MFRMKNLLLFFAALLLQHAASSQMPFNGKWVGSLNNVNSFRMVFNISGDNNSLKATLDVPTQNAKDVPCKTIRVTKEDSVFITMPDINGSYAGKLTDVNKISGYWTQNGMSLVLNLARTEGKVELNRPQTPMPPFSYYSDDVVFYNDTKSMYYGATITYPKDEAKHPALILISGSGPQNRDEELFDHRPFAVVADYLTKKGYVVLRVDDRGVGKTGGDRTNATSADYAKDVNDAIAYLKTRKEVDKKKIGLYGHSEGGMIAQMVAAENKDIAFIILMAAPGVKVTQLMTEQNVALMNNAGLSREVSDSYGKLYNDMVAGIVSSSSRTEASSRLYAAVDKWKAITDPEIVTLTTGIKDSASRVLFTETFLDAVWNKWMTYFLQYDPAPVLAKVQCKVLAINGDKDVQVISTSNLAGIKNALSKSKSKDYETVEVKGVNHLFQECKECTTSEYGVLEQTIKPEVLEIVAKWLDSHVK